MNVLLETQGAHERRWKRYPTYRDSGVEWLGAVPEGWDVKRLKRMFRVINGSTPKSGIYEYWDGDISWVTPDDLGRLKSEAINETARKITDLGYQSCGTTLAPAGSLVLSTRAPIGHLAIAEIDLCANQGCRSLIFKYGDNKRYFYYQLLAARPELESWGQGSTFRELGKGKLEAIELFSPPIPEQRAIAAFLYRETGRIDALIAKKGRQIELLQEKRAALISHAVTKGLDPDAPMKDSGVEWLGEVPEHWNIVHLKRVFHSTDYGISESLQADGVYGILRMGDIQDGEILMDDLGYVDSVAQELLLDQGDLVFNRTNSLALVGKVGIFRGTIEDNISFASYLVRLRIKDASDPEYFNYMLNRPEVLVKASSMALPSIGQANLNPNRYGYLRICAPPKKEQDEIARFLRDKTCKIDRLKEKINGSISKLREYRTALISAAVTGKIDVREELVS